MKSLRQRFVEKFEPEPMSGCWLWMGAVRGGTGYGNITTEKGDDGKWRQDLAHRVSYRLYIGPIPEELIVRHWCHNRVCVNPAHLRLGTHRDNAQDKIRAGRCPWTTRTHCPKGHPYSGTNLVVSHRSNGRRFRACRACRNEESRIRYRKNHVLAKRLSPDAVREIRRRYAAGGITQRELASEFGVARPTVADITQGRAWRNVQ